MKKSFLIIMILTFLFPIFNVFSSDNVLEFIDSLGREVILPKNIERIVPSGSLSQMTLLTIAPGKMVALSNGLSDKEKEFINIEDLPIIGQLYGSGQELNLESLLLADPQVIIDVGEPKKGLKEDLDKITLQTGIPAVHISSSLENMDEVYKTIGLILNMEKEVEQLADYCSRVYEDSLSFVSNMAGNKEKILYITGYDGLRVVGKNTYNSEVLDMIGENVAIIENAKGGSQEVDMEQIYIFSPDIIIFDSQSYYDTVEEDPLWKDLKPIKENKYVESPFGPYNWLGFPPSVQRYLGILWLTDLIYGDLVEYDLFSEVSEYFNLFYKKDLSREEYQDLLKNSFFKIDANNDSGRN